MHELLHNTTILSSVLHTPWEGETREQHKDPFRPSFTCNIVGMCIIIHISMCIDKKIYIKTTQQLEHINILYL